MPYDATAERPDWAELPKELRAAITDRLGGPVRGARTARGGFTRGFAGVLELPDEQVFVKAAHIGEEPHLADWYAHEARVVQRLPYGIPAPRPRWVSTLAGYVVLCLDAVDGRLPRLPWVREELSATLDAYARVAEALRDPPPALVELGLPGLADLARSGLSWWQEIAAGREQPPPGLHLCPDRLAALAALEARLPTYADVPSLIHCDLRLDNVLLDRAGRAWMCDWTWLCHGPAWFDLAGLLVTAYASGLDADRIFSAHPAAAGAPPDALEVSLAALSGHLLTGADTDPFTASRHLRQHQRWSGSMALRWLGERRGWRDGFLS